MSPLLYPKLHKRLPLSTFKQAWKPASSYSEQVPSGVIRDVMTKKSISGTQGIFSRHVVEKMLASPDVMELFALSKYACCCCVEERNWIAALGIISRSSNAGEDGIGDDDITVHVGAPGKKAGTVAGVDFQQEALRQGSMFELWGGEKGEGTGSECGSSMKNAVLTSDKSVCYKIDDHQLIEAAEAGKGIEHEHHHHVAVANSSEPAPQHYFFGNETWSYLRLAKTMGYFFARKFDSSDAQSMELVQDVQLKLWEED